MEKYLVLATFVGSIIALLFALITGKRVLSYEEGTPLMSKISRSIREGANAYLRRQYTVVGIFFACIAIDSVRDRLFRLLRVNDRIDTLFVKIKPKNNAI